MYRGKVIGNVVATIKDPHLTGMKFLVVQLIDDDGNPIGDPIVAADAIRVSGEGDEVYLAMKREAAIAFPPPFPPIDAAITGFIDEYWIVHDEDRYRVPKKKSEPTPKPTAAPSDQNPDHPPKSSIPQKKKKRPEAEIRSPLSQNESEEDN